MNVQTVLFFCFLSALCGGNTRLVSAVNIWAGPKGGEGSISCYLSGSGSTKFFCKNECKEKKDILIKTDGSSAQNGRYSIKYEGRSTTGKQVVSVTISDMIQSDSGRYRCGVTGDSARTEYSEFEVRVSDELDKNDGFTRTVNEGESLTRGCFNTVYGTRKFFCKDKCQREEDVLIDTNKNKDQCGRYSLKYRNGSASGLDVTISHVTRSDSGWYRCGYGNPQSPDSSYDFTFIVIGAEQPTTQSSTSSSGSFTSASPENTPAATTTHTDSSYDYDFPDYFVPLVVCVSVVNVLLLVVLLVAYIWKRNRGNSDQTIMELSENMTPPSKHDNHVYQSLNPANRDKDQFYSA